MKHARPTVLYAAAVRDATGVNASPGAVLVQNGRVVAAGEPGSLPVELVEQAEVIERRDSLILPCMVNAHTHFELHAIGPQPYQSERGFVGWVTQLREVIQDQIYESGRSGPEWYGPAKQKGWRQCCADGSYLVGDISQSVGQYDAPSNQLLKAVTFKEIFGLGPPFDREGLKQIGAGLDAIQPHAPYSSGPSLYAAAARSGRHISTHLAETREEVDFVAQLKGPLLDYVKQIGRWDEAFATSYGQGLSPVQWMRPHLEAAALDGGWLVAHCNYVDDDDIRLLAETNTSVAYCPIASHYFGHTGHRYRDMLEAGINVCLGTDSIVCQPVDEPHPYGILPQMRALYQRDGTDPQALLEMATVNGAKALGADSFVPTLSKMGRAHLICVDIDTASDIDPFEQVLRGEQEYEVVYFWA